MRAVACRVGLRAMIACRAASWSAGAVWGAGWACRDPGGVQQFRQGGSRPESGLCEVGSPSLRIPSSGERGPKGTGVEHPAGGWEAVVSRVWSGSREGGGGRGKMHREGWWMTRAAGAV